MNIENLIRPELVEINVAARNWEEAIRAAGKLMVASGAVETRFPEAMIRVAKEFGPYIVVAPGIALPHAQPEDGVLKASIAVVRLNEAVNFGNADNDPVFLVVALAAIDHEEHIQGLMEVANVLGNEQCVEKLKAAKTKEELREVFFIKEEAI
ncbi:MAG: PTS sugar transporter subunit IIA [Chloroflexi bacterium]|nr:PTS sugar transporter subunit IIA [Chloroflexota bacterium]